MTGEWNFEGCPGPNVIQIGPARVAMTYAPLGRLEAYWQGLRRGRAVPLRSEIDPRGIESLLEHAFLLERIAPGHARFRLAGSAFTRLLGMEARGMPFSTIFLPEARREPGPMLEEVFAGPAIAEFALAAPRSLGRPALEARCLLLPLKSDLGDVSRAVGCLVSRGRTGRAPRRFTLSHTQLRPVGDTRPGSGRACPPAPSRDRPPGPSRPYLRLVGPEE